MEHKIKDLVLTQSMVVEKPKQLDETFKISGEVEPYELAEMDMSFEEKIDKLLKLLLESKFVERPLKKAYIDEELQISG